jgi:hypothetical protein
MAQPQLLQIQPQLQADRQHVSLSGSLLLR